MEPLYIFWVAVIIISIIAEIATLQLVSLWFVIGGLFALAVSLFTQSIPVQIIVFTVVSVSMIVLVRPFIKNVLKFKVEETNAGRLIGRHAVVTKDIDNSLGKGEVNIEGSIWSARSKNNDVIAKGETVQIESILGVKLIVYKI